MNQEIALLNAKRQLIARRITAENDYEAISDEFWASQKRIWIPALVEIAPRTFIAREWTRTERYRFYMGSAMTRAFFDRSWARTDCKGFA